MIAEITIALLVISLVVAFGIYFYLEIKKSNKKMQEVHDIEAANAKKIKEISTNYPNQTKYLTSITNQISDSTNMQKQQIDITKGNIQEEIDSYYKTFSDSFGASNTAINDTINTFASEFSTNNLTVDGFSFSKDGGDTLKILNNDGGYINTDSLRANSLATSNIALGGFFIANSNQELHFSGPGKINFMSDVTMSNISAQSMNITGRLNFADINSPTTFDMSPEGNMRIIMERGSNGISPFRSFDVVNEGGTVVHKFDIQGNATHDKDVIINGKCISFGSNNGNICYDTGKGVNIQGGYCNVVTISDNINTGSLSTNVLDIGSLSITSSNGNLVVIDNNTNDTLGSIALMQMI